MDVFLYQGCSYILWKWLLLVKKKINFDNSWVLWYFAIFSTFQKNFYNPLFQLFHLKELIKSDWTFLKFFLGDPVFPQSWSCPLSTSKPFTLTNPSSLVIGFFKYMFLTKTEQKGKIRKNVFGLFYISRCCAKYNHVVIM